MNSGCLLLATAQSAEAYDVNNALAILQVIGKATETRMFFVRSTDPGDHTCDMKCYPNNDHDYY